MKIWQRYLFGQIARVFLFFLVALFCVYLFIDLSIHSMKFLQGGYELSDLVRFYLYNFSSLLDLFAPLAFLLASLKVLSDLSSHLELLSLQMARLSMKKILVPFFALAALLTGLGYANHEWVTPQAAIFLKTFKVNHTQKKQLRLSKKVQTTHLEDGSKLVYHLLDRENQLASDVFWIRTSNDIWHMKTLSFESFPPTAAFADHLIGVDGKLEKAESFDQKIFSEIPLRTKLEPSIVFRPEKKALSTLFKIANAGTAIRAHMHHKLVMPLLPFLILLAIAPLTLIHTRDRRTFLITCLSLLSFIVVMILFDTLLVLGINNIIEPWLALWIVPFLLVSLSIRKFAKI